MPVPTTTPVQSQKNIWVAAGDGDLDRVRELVEHHSISPNTPDPHTYTPMHAAASYGQLQVLEYLISRGGNVNVTDSDGDTPLYTVENVETARYLVEHGAIVNQHNNEGISPIQHLEDDFAEVASYLQTVSGAGTLPAPAVPSPPSPPSQHQQNITSEQLTSSLIESIQDVMRRAELEGRDADDEIRQIVSQTVVEGVVAGYQMTEGDGGNDDIGESHGPNGTKRPRT